MEEWTDLHALFVRYSNDAADDGTPQHEGHRHMSLFQVKCALVALYGGEISSHTIKQTLTDINPEWNTEGVNEDTFQKLAMLFNVKSEQEIVYEAYKELDKLNRGYISAEQFKNMMSSLLPHLDPSHLESLFEAADMYQMGKVTFPQFKILMRQLNPRLEKEITEGMNLSQSVQHTASTTIVSDIR